MTLTNFANIQQIIIMWDLWTISVKWNITATARSLISCYFYSAASKPNTLTGGNQRCFFFFLFLFLLPPAGGRYKRHVPGQQAGQRPGEELPHLQQGPDVGAATRSLRRRGWKQPQLHPGEAPAAVRTPSFIHNDLCAIHHSSNLLTLIICAANRQLWQVSCSVLGVWVGRTGGCLDVFSHTYILQCTGCIVFTVVPSFVAFSYGVQTFH